jgi:hypothetical protein
MRTMLGVDIGLLKASRKRHRITDNVEEPILTTSFGGDNMIRKAKRMVSLIYLCRSANNTIAYECFCLYRKLRVAKSLVTLRSTRRATKDQTRTTLTSSAARQPWIGW